MIIINIKHIPRAVRNNKIKCIGNEYILSVDYIDNEISEVLFKETTKNTIYFYDTKIRFHNPVEPAVEFRENSAFFVDYYLKGRRYSKEEFKRAVNDYCKL